MSSNAAATAVAERKLDQSVQTVFSRTKDLKMALEGLIAKIDTDITYQPDGPNWPSLLDSFSLIAGQIATLTKYLQNEKTPELRNTSCYPLLLNPDKDDAILKMTEGRVPCVNHEVVPDYFRTKPDPAVEAREKKMEEEANKAQSQMKIQEEQAMKLNTICDKLIDKVLTSRQNENFGEKRLINPKYFERDETENLVATYCHGRNLQPLGQSNQSAARQSNMQMQGQGGMSRDAPSGMGISIRNPGMMSQGGIKQEPGMTHRQVQKPHPYQRP